MPTTTPVADIAAAPIDECVPALAAGECQAIGEALRDRSDAGESIHEARKAIRRLRSLLALADDRVEGLAAADRSLERLGEGLSTLRDSHVVIAAAQGMAERHGAAAWQLVIGRLSRRRRSLLAQALADDPGFARRRRTVARIERTLRGLDWSALRKKDVRAALKRSQRRADRAGKRADSAPTPENLHRLRRRTRRLRMQLEAARALAPDTAKAVARPSPGKRLDALNKLGDALGWHQDLQVLRGLLGKMSRLPQRPLLLEQLRVEIDSARSCR